MKINNRSYDSNKFYFNKSEAAFRKLLKAEDVQGFLQEVSSKYRILENKLIVPGFHMLSLTPV